LRCSGGSAVGATSAASVTGTSKPSNGAKNPAIAAEEEEEEGEAGAAAAAVARGQVVTTAAAAAAAVGARAAAAGKQPVRWQHASARS